MNKPMMKCGHAANAIDGLGRDCCVICAPSSEAYEIVETPDLSTRKARCSYYNKSFTTNGRGANECSSCDKQLDHRCHCEEPSSTNLAFFTRHPEKEFDEFYCGCMGWD